MSSLAFVALSPGGTLALLGAAVLGAAVLARLSVMLATVDARAKRREQRARKRLVRRKR